MRPSNYRTAEGNEPDTLGTCTNCGKPYPVRFTDAGHAVPIGITDCCNDCGNDSFSPLGEE